LSPIKAPEPKKPDTDLARVEEAMRRATWEATHGPRELRSGRFNPYPAKPAAAE
jgi:hypothetical protein